MHLRPKHATVGIAAACLLALVAQLEIWAPRFVPGVGVVVGDRGVLAVTSLVATLSLAGRRHRPLAVLCSVLGALALQQLLTTPTHGLVLLITAMVAAYSSSAYSTATRGGSAGVAVVIGSALIGDDTGDWAFLAVVLGGAWLVGFVVMQRSTDLTQAREDIRDLAMRLRQAAEQLAYAQQSSTSASSESVAGLTTREVDVARAVARGMSNAEIARELFISEWTVKTHVASILRKLGLRDRAQIVVASYESGLVQPRGSLLVSAADEPATSPPSDRIKQR